MLEIGYLTKGLPTGFYHRNYPVSASCAGQLLVDRVDNDPLAEFVVNMPRPSGRYVLSLLSDGRRTLQLSGRGFGSDTGAGVPADRSSGSDPRR